MASKKTAKSSTTTSKVAAVSKTAANGKQPADDEEQEAAGIEVMTDDQRRMLDLVTVEFNQIQACDRLLDGLCAKVRDAERRLASLELRCPTALLWRVDDVASRLRTARAGHVTAFEGSGQPLSRLGYRLAITVCLNGEGRARGRFVSLFVSICKGDFDSLLTWPFNQRLYLSIVNQAQAPGGRDITQLLMPNICKENNPFLGRPVADRNAKFGIEDFAPIERVLGGGQRGEQFLLDDALYVRLEVPMEDFEP